MILQITFGILASLFIIGISYFTSRTYGNAFHFTGVPMRATFLTFLLIPLMFIVSVISQRSTRWHIGPYGYTAIQILAGIGFYLSLGALVLGLLMLIAKLFHTSIPFAVSSGIVVLSVSASLMGLYQARHIVIKDYTVQLKGAPSSWNGKTAVLVTDTHFGLVNYTKFSTKVISAIETIRPDFIMHAGDFYDGPTIATEPISEQWKALSKKIPIFYAPGNHETYGNYNGFIDSIAKADITVLDNKKVLYDGVTIAGITYAEGKNSPAAAAALHYLQLDPTVPTILINHPPTSLIAAEQAGVDLMVSGHTHNGQFWPANYIVKMVYGIYGYGLHAYNSMQVLTSKGVGTFGPPLRLFNNAEIVRITFSTTK